MSVSQPVDKAEEEAAPAPPSFHAKPAAAALRILLVRARFAVMLAAALLVVGYWPTLRNHVERLLRTSRQADLGISTDTEYWCPMCPGVVSDWPSKCPICNMTLVRRKKGEATPLPDGVLARMQFSPYRIQLAGIRTAVVDFRLLKHEVVLVGPMQRSASGVVEVCAEALPTDFPFLSVGQVIDVSVDGLPGHQPFRGKVVRIEPGVGPADRAALVRLQIDDSAGELRSGILATARAQAPLSQLPWWRQSVMEEWRKQACVEMMAQSLTAPLAATSSRVRSLLEHGVYRGTFAAGASLSVPCDAVIDHGSRKVAFVESGPSMYDAVEVVVGPRCGDFYPILRGLQQGQRVAASGAFLLDAEMCLNHDLSAAWFGATRSANNSSHHETPASSSSTQNDERQLIAKQKTCPVTGKPLGSMGGPVRVEVGGRIVYVCCEGCSEPLRESPAKFFEKLK